MTSEPSYMATLDYGNTRRILDICCYSDVSGNIGIVTAGLDLLVWKQVSDSRYSLYIIDVEYSHLNRTLIRTQ